MNAFEYAMVLISIIVGLGITHILSNLGTAVHRLRHHGPAIRLEWNYLVWIAFVFTWLVNFWWWEFKWSELAPDFGFGLYMFLVLYATSLFLLAVILVPPRLSVVVDSWEYFLAIRYWFYGGLLVINGIDVVDTFMKGAEWGFRTSYVVYWTALTAAGIVGLNTTRRGVTQPICLVLPDLLQDRLPKLTPFDGAAGVAWNTEVRLSADFRSRRRPIVRRDAENPLRFIAKLHQ
jgi:hypothetical protein